MIDALSRWHALTRYADDGTPEIDNNAAAIYSLLGSAKLNGLDPEIYLLHVLTQIADYPINRIDDLLPGTYRSPVHTNSPE